jgi:hypothetical protein
VQQVEHEGADPLAILHRRRHPIGEACPRLGSARRATAIVRPVFGDDQRLRFGQIEDLPRDVASGHRLGHWRTAPGAGRRVMIDHRIGRLGSAQCLARMSLLSARLLAGAFPQAVGPGRLHQPVARWRLAAVAAVQPEPALQLRNARPHRCHLGHVTRLLRQQQGDEVLLRQLFKNGAIHQFLGICRPKSCQHKSRPRAAITRRPRRFKSPERLARSSGQPGDYLGSYGIS